MSDNNGQSLDGYYFHIRSAGKLMSDEHALQWSNGVLRTLGTALDGRTKRALAKSLPKELADQLKGVFWLLHFRDPEMSSSEFLQRAARRSGNSNVEFAYYPTVAVFNSLKQFVDDNLDSQVSNSLSPDIREMWGNDKLESEGA
jgi:uncharacterized protein (DUF2267 family)